MSERPNSAYGPPLLGDVLISAHSPPYTYSGSFTRSRQFLVPGNFDPRTYTFPSSPPFPLLTTQNDHYIHVLCQRRYTTFGDLYRIYALNGRKLDIFVRADHSSMGLLLAMQRAMRTSARDDGEQTLPPSASG